MGRFNTYQSDLKYEPRSFEKMAMLPMQLRKAQDAAEADANLVELNAANTKVSSGYQEAYDKQKQAFDNKAADISARLAKEGSGNPALMQEFTNLKRQYNLAASATGVFGAGAKRFKDEAEAEKAYTEYGITKAGQGYESVSSAWKEKMAGENEEIRKGLAENPNFIAKEMVHEYAPNKFDLGDFALKMKGIIGMNGGSSSEDLVAGLTKDPATGQMSVNTNSTAWKNNKEQLMQFAQLAKSNLFDPTSDLNKHLRYNKRSLKEYLGDIDSYVGMMKVDEINTANKINPIGNGSSSGGSGAADKEEEGVIVTEKTNRSPTLDVKLPGYNGGAGVKMNGANVKGIKRHMEMLEQAGDPIIYTPEYVAQKQAAISLDENVMKWDVANRSAMEEAFKKSKYFSRDGKRGLEGKINKASSYGEFISKQKEMEAQTAESLKKSGYSDLKIKSIMAESAAYMDKVNQDIRVETGQSDLMYKQNIYGFGFNDASAKLIESSVPYLKSQAQFFKDQAGKNSFAYEVDAQGNETPIDISELGASAADDIRISSIATRNGRGVPSIGITMKYKGTGGVADSEKRLDLEVKDEAGNIGKETVMRILSQTKDPKARYTLQSILDSASVNQVIPDSKEYEGSGTMTKGASKAQSNMIIAINASSNTGQNMNTINKTGSYQIISQGPHYALKVKQKGDADYHVYNVKDLLFDRIPKDNSTSDRYKQNVKNEEVASLYKLLGYNPKVGVDSFNNTSNPIVPEDSGSKRNTLSLALNEYADVFNKSGATQKERDEATNTLAEVAGNVGLKSMNKAAFLKN
jgi:hypothetical protein